MTAEPGPKALRGILPVIPTLFTVDDRIDQEAQKQVVEFAIQQGASAVVCPAVASEYNFLSLDERKTLVALVSGQVNGRVPIIGGASANTVNDVVSAAHDCQEFGITTLMIMAPRVLGPDIEKQVTFFSEICNQLGDDARVLLQNAPEPVGAGLGVEDMVHLVKSNPKIQYVKEETLPSGPAITALNQCGIDHLEGVIGGGGSRYLIDELNRGAVAAMPAVELIDLHVAIFNAHTDGNHDLARKLYRDSLPLLVSQLIYRMRLTKYVLHRRGISNDRVVRAPLPEMDEYTLRDIDRMLEDLQETLA